MIHIKKLCQVRDSISPYVQCSAISSIHNIRKLAEVPSLFLWNKLLKSIFIGILLAILISLGAVGPVSGGDFKLYTTATLTASGGTNINNPYPNEVRWGGLAGYAYQSGLRFDGETVDTDVGNEFCLGKLTHFNWPVYDAADDASMTVTLHFTTPSAPDLGFNFVIDIDETTNPTGTCTPTNCASFGCTYCPCTTIPCPDRVTFPNAISGGTFNIGLSTYALEITGFSTTCTGGGAVGYLNSQETLDNSAYLVGRIIEVVPLIKLEKYTNGEDADTAPGPTILEGCPVTWTYTLDYTGTSYSLANIQLTDNVLGTITGYSGDSNGNSRIDPGEIWTYTRTGTAQAGQYSNLGTASGRVRYGSNNYGPYMYNTDPSQYYGQTLTFDGPTSQTVCYGSPATFSATLTPADTGQYNYQWQSSSNSGSTWNNIAGATSSSYTVPSATYVTPSMQYRVRVALKTQNTCWKDSNPATLTVNPTISLTGPSPTTVCDGGTASFSVTPNPAYTYQWQVNSGSGWGDVTTGTGGATAQYSFTAAYADNGKQYRVVVGYASPPTCPVTSSAALLTVRPTISLDCPDDVSLCNGGTATFTVTPNPADEGQYQYQWDVSTDGGTTWTPITTATGPIYSFTASLADNGNKYRVTVKYNTMPDCEASPCIATLTVQGGSTVTVGSSMTICVEDGPITLSGTATNAQSAQWSVESGGDYGEVTSNSYNPTTGSVTAVFTPKSSGDFSNDVVVKLTATPKSPCSGDVSNTRTVTVVQKPSINIIVIQPAP